MGMFDGVRCRYPLPWPEVQEDTWQSKDTPAQYLELYEIRADGSLWHEADSEKGSHWLPVSDYSGELEMHTLVRYPDRPGHTWYSVQFLFKDGLVKVMTPKKVES